MLEAAEVAGSWAAERVGGLALAAMTVLKGETKSKSLEEAATPEGCIPILLRLSELSRLTSEV